MQSLQLSNGRFACAEALEIVAAPDADSTRTGAADNVGARLTTLLHELAALELIYIPEVDLSLELLISAHPDERAAPRAALSSILIVRALSPTATLAEAAIADALEMVESSLDPKIARLVETDLDLIRSRRRGASHQAVAGVSRRARIINLHNDYVSASLVYDRVPEGAISLARVLDTVGANPGSAFSVIITPTRFTPAEADLIGTIATGLGAVAQGVSVSDGQQVLATNATRPAEAMRYYVDHLSSTVYAISLVASGPTHVVRRLSSRLIGAVAAASPEGSCDMHVVALDVDSLGMGVDETALSWRLQSAIDQAAQGVRSPSIAEEAAYRLPALMTGHEATKFLVDPVIRSVTAAP